MKNGKWAVALGIALFALGLIVLFNGTNIGIGLARQALWANGGTLDTEEYYFIMRSNTLGYQLGGAVVSAIGGACAIVFGRKSMK